jgi:alkylation response protein AidB-like acyl-CoA dehydrogenase
VYLVADKKQQLHMVEANAQGLTKAGFKTVDATRELGELTFDNVPCSSLSCTPEQVASVLDWGRVALAADSLGAAQNMLDQAVDYAKQREQFNRVISSFQAVKHMCAEMAASLEPCRAMVWYAGYASDAGLDDARQYALHTKAHLSEVCQFVARTATEVHGGMGFTDLLGLHYWFKRIGANRQLLGSPERLRNDAALDANLISV